MTFVDADGAPVAGGAVWTYAYGSLTLTKTYSDVNETVVNANPVPLDAAGTALIFATGGFSFVVLDQYGNQVTGASGPVQGQVSPAMLPVTEATTTSAALVALGALAASAYAPLVEQTIVASQVAQPYKSYVVTQAATLTLPLTTTLTTGWWTEVLAAGAGAVTLQPQGTDKIDGLAVGTAVVLQPSQSGKLVTDANGNWWIQALTAVAEVTSPFVFSAGQGGNFTVGAGGTKISYEGWAGGGAAGACDSTHAAGAGGGGGYFSDSLACSTGQVFAYYVGSGGTAQPLGANGNGGQATTFGVASATGGSGGGQGSGGFGAGGAAGSGINAHVGLAGQPGGAGSSAAAGVLVGGEGGGTVKFGGTVQAINAAGKMAWGIGTGGGGGAGTGAAGQSGTAGANGLLIVQVSQF